MQACEPPSTCAIIHTCIIHACLHDIPSYFSTYACTYIHTYIYIFGDLDVDVDIDTNHMHIRAHLHMHTHAKIPPPPAPKAPEHDAHQPQIHD